LAEKNGDEFDDVEIIFKNHPPVMSAYLFLSGIEQRGEGI
jgi:hypothetical protein